MTATAPPHPVIYNLGRDRRGIPADLSAGNRGKILGMLMDPSGQLPAPVLSSIPPINAPFYNIPYTFDLTRQYWPVASAPFSVDADGRSFPAGTVWIYVPGLQVATNAYPGQTVVLVYRAGGIPSGSAGTITIQNSSSVTIATVSIPYKGVCAVALSASFAWPADDLGITVSPSWSAGSPVTEGWTLSLDSGGGDATFTNGNFVAVPAVLPYGYTPRPALDFERGGTFGMSRQNWKRLRAGPNTTYANMGLLSGSSLLEDNAFGQMHGSELGGNIWVDGSLWSYSYPIAAAPGFEFWAPQAIGPACPSVAAATFLGGIGPIFSSADPTPGARNCKLHVTFGGSTPPAGDSVTIKVVQDGTLTLYTNTATGSAISSLAGDFDMATLPTLPPAGVATTIAVVITGTTTATPGSYSVGATLTISPRCDIPLPFTVVGRDLAVLGGYIPSLLGTPVNRQPLTRLASGVTSYGNSTAFNVAFKPTADGWYEVLNGDVPTIGVGEDPFGWLDQQTVSRGHDGYPFFAACPVGGTAELTAISPPSPTAIASTGTTVNATFGGRYAFVSVALPAAGRYNVNFRGANGLAYQCGFQVQWSSTDPTMIDPVSAPLVWEPICEWMSGLAYDSVNGFLINTPPSSPSPGFLYAIGPAPTGVWVGYKGMLATWDGNTHQWDFFEPQVNSCLNDQYWYDGRDWHTNGTDPHLVMAFDVAVATTIYFLIYTFDNSFFFTPGTPQCVVSWEATA